MVVNKKQNSACGSSDAFSTRPFAGRYAIEMEIGHRDTFSLVVGKKISPKQQYVDIWTGGVRLTYIDNLVYVPQFVTSVRREMEILKTRNLPKCYAALHWGPTTDDFVGRFKIRNSAEIQLHCKLDNGSKVTTNIAIEKLIAVYSQCLDELEKTT